MLIVIIIFCTLVFNKESMDNVTNIIEYCVIGLIIGIFAGAICGTFLQDIHKPSSNSIRYKEMSSESFQISDVDIYVNNESGSFIICSSKNFENVSYSIKLDKLERIDSDENILIKKKLQYKPAGWEYYMFGPIPNILIKIRNDNYLYELRYSFGKYHYITPEILDM